jgi:hypothetical protein
MAFTLSLSMALTPLSKDICPSALQLMKALKKGKKDKIDGHFLEKDDYAWIAMQSVLAALEKAKGSVLKLQ